MAYLKIVDFFTDRLTSADAVTSEEYLNQTPPKLGGWAVQTIYRIEFLDLRRINRHQILTDKCRLKFLLLLMYDKNIT